MLEHQGSVRSNIRLLCEEYPELVDSYKDLYVMYWIVFDNVGAIEDIIEATSAETIRRNFQKLVQQGLIKPPKRTIERRRKLEEKMRQEMAVNG